MRASRATFALSPSAHEEEKPTTPIRRLLLYAGSVRPVRLAQ